MRFCHGLVAGDLERHAAAVSSQEAQLEILGSLLQHVEAVEAHGEARVRSTSGLGWRQKLAEVGLASAEEQVSLAAARRRIDRCMAVVSDALANDRADAAFCDAVLRRDVAAASAQARVIFERQSEAHEVVMTAPEVAIRVRRAGGGHEVLSTAKTGPSQVAVDLGAIFMDNHAGRQKVLSRMRQGCYPGWCSAAGCVMGAAKRCGRCGAGYCGATCQAAHWPAHKGECRSR